MTSEKDELGSKMDKTIKRIDILIIIVVLSNLETRTGISVLVGLLILAIKSIF